MILWLFSNWSIFCEFGVNFQTLSEEPSTQFLSRWLYAGIDNIHRQNFWHQRGDLHIYEFFLWLALSTSFHSAFETITRREEVPKKKNNFWTFNESYLNYFASTLFWGRPYYINLVYWFVQQNQSPIYCREPTIQVNMT